jgi:hypothetical protein
MAIFNSHVKLPEGTPCESDLGLGQSYFEDVDINGFSWNAHISLVSMLCQARMASLAHLVHPWAHHSPVPTWESEEPWLMMKNQTTWTWLM